MTARPGLAGVLQVVSHEVTPTAASTVVVPPVGAAVPVAEAVPEEEELCEKRDILRMKHCYKKNEVDKRRFPNAHVGSFGRWAGATWCRRPLGPYH
jgi:hypothetical protein